MITNYNSAFSAFGFSNLMRFLFLTAFFIFLVFCFIIFNARNQSTDSINLSSINLTTGNKDCPQFYSIELSKNYNHTYPLTTVIKSKNFIRYRIGLISDEDRKSGSYSKNSWSSFYHKGYLTYYPSTKRIEIKFDEKKIKLTNQLSNGKRGLELSELIVYDGKLLTCDDKTGIIYQLIENDQNVNTNSTTNSTDEIDTYKLIPKFILSDGNGEKDEVFKCEWMTVKETNGIKYLYVGSFGRNFEMKKKTKYTTWIKRIDMNGHIEHLDWSDKFGRLQDALKLPKNGYISHETAMWSSVKNKWFFLPRKISNIPWSFNEDESKGSNIMIESSDDFKDIKYHSVGPLDRYHGFSSSKWLPDFNDEIIIALKTKEINDNYSTFIIVFDINGNVIYPETLVDDQLKFEGIEFV